MNARQFERWLRKNHGIVSQIKKGTGHKILYNPSNGTYSQLPMHGARHQLGTKLINKIMKDLGLK